MLTTLKESHPIVRKEYICNLCGCKINKGQRYYRLAEYLNQNLHIDQTLGVLIITHSRTMVKHLKHDNFINLENMSEEQWLNREIIPMSPAELLKNSSELYQAFQKRLKP